MGRHANGDTPTGVLFVRPDDPKFRRAAGGRKTGKIPRIAPAADTGFLPAQAGASSVSTPDRAATATIPAQRREPAMAGSAQPRGAARAAIATPMPRSAPPRPRSAPPMMARPLGPGPMEPPTVRVPSSLSRVQLSLPMWTKVCLVLGAVLLVVGFGGLAASYAVGQHADARTAGSELIKR